MEIQEKITEQFKKEIECCEIIKIEIIDDLAFLFTTRGHWTCKINTRGIKKNSIRINN